jgi:hypothetical protein
MAVMGSRDVLGWRPESAENVAWLRGEAKRRDEAAGQKRGALGAMLDEAIKDLRAKIEQGRPLLVEDEPPPRPFFDDRDLSAIALYEQEEAPGG